MARVIVLPGFLGSRLRQASASLYGPPVIWPPGDLGSLANLIQLQLDPTGKLPGPLTTGDPLFPSGILLDYYGRLIEALRGPHSPTAIAYDWRMSLADLANPVAASIRVAFPVGPVAIVAHSMGGLVAKAALQALISMGLTTYISKIIFLGTPQYGSWETYRLLYRLPDLYRRLVETSGVRWILGGAPNTEVVLDAITPTWPATFELMPYRDSGPLHLADPSVAEGLYARRQYLPNVPRVTQARLDAAWPVQNAYSGVPGTVPYATILGEAGRTAYDLHGDEPSTVQRGYLYTTDGDGIVTDAQATLPGAVTFTFTADHNLLPVSPGAIQLVLAALAGL
jgi:pimeloyl-ACP methyl ester carboxylesterase